jgi:hypothetical protein
MENIKLSSDEWIKLSGIIVTDPDGWDRKNFDVSWHEKITFDEFYNRASISTCIGWPLRMDYDQLKSCVFDKILTK